MYTICTAISKGGTLKTSSTQCIAETLSKLKYKVLLIDTDSQADLTRIFGAKSEGEYTLYDVLTGECTSKESIQKTIVEGIDIIPGDTLLSSIQNDLMQTDNYELRLKKVLEPLSDSYDFCLIDTPPGLGTYPIMSLSSCDFVFVPMKADKLSKDALLASLKVFKQIKENFNPQLEILGVSLVAYDGRFSLDKKRKANLEKEGKIFDFHPFKTVIRTCQACKNAQDEGVSLFDYDISSSAVEDYISLTDEILVRIKEIEETRN